MIHNEETRDQAAHTLNGLIAILEDGKLGYTNAAEHIEEPAIKAEFFEYAQQRAHFITELQNEITTLGKTPEESTGGPLGALHRVWTDIKATLTGSDTDAIINACITGEEAAIEKFKEALDKNIFENSQTSIVSRQLSLLENTLTKVKARKQS